MTDTPIDPTALEAIAKAICNASEVSTVRGGVCRMANLYGAGQCTVCLAQAKAAITAYNAALGNDDG